jgi:hypothetical protein
MSADRWLDDAQKGGPKFSQADGFWLVPLSGPNHYDLLGDKLRDGTIAILWA